MKICYWIVVLISVFSSMEKSSSTDMSVKPDSTTQSDRTTLSNIRNYSDDHIAIRQLVDRYNDLINHRDWKGISEIFSINATWQALNPINLKWSGLDNIQKSLPESVERLEV